jgi:hypothetical protein
MKENSGVMDQDGVKENAPKDYGEEKARLECGKLQAEILAIQKPHLTPMFYVALCPVILAVLTMIGAWCSGWFDVQRTRVENEKRLVEAQTEVLKVERSRLSRETEEQRKHVVALENEVVLLKAKETILTNQISRLEQDRNEMRMAKEVFEYQAKRLAGSETNTVYFFTQLQLAQASRERLADENRALHATNELLRVALTNQEALLDRAGDLMLEPALSLLIDDFSLDGARAHFNRAIRWRADLEIARNHPEKASDTLSTMEWYTTNWPKSIKTRK